MEEFLEQIAQELPPSESRDVYATLAKVLGNIARNPGETRFRTLKKENRVVAEHICVSMAAVSLLLLVGFEDHGETFVCPMCTDLEQVQAASEKLQHRTLNLDVLAQGADTGASSSSQPTPLVDLADELDPFACWAEGVAPPSRGGAAAEGSHCGAEGGLEDLLTGELSDGATASLDLLMGPEAAAAGGGDRAAGGNPRAGHSDAPAPGDGLREDDLLSVASDATQGSQMPELRGKTEKGKLLPRTFKKRSEEEKLRVQAVESVEEIRRAQREKFAEGACRKTNASQQGSGNRLGSVGQPVDSADLLSIASDATLETAAPRATQESTTEKKKEDPRAFKDRRKDEQQRQQATQSLQDMKRLQKEKYEQFKSDPSSQASEAYSRPPSGSCDPNAKLARPAGSSVSAPGSEDGPAWEKWLSETSPALADTSKQLRQGLSETSDRISTGFSDASKQLTERLSGQLQAAGLGDWLGSGSPAENAGNYPASLSRSPPEPGVLPHRFLVHGKVGALVRVGMEKSTPQVGLLPEGTTFVALEAARNSEGTWRLRLEEPARGWVTFKEDIVKRVSSPESESQVRAADL